MTLTFGSGTHTHGSLLLSGSIHGIILIIAAQIDSPQVWPWALLAMSIVSFLAWVGNYRRYRQIHDLPTSKIASAAQGYVELVGRSKLLDGDMVHCPISQRPCCWYRYVIEEQQSDDKFRVIDKGMSVDHFLLIDDTGQCVISPEGAEVVTRHHRSWRDGRMRYQEWLLLPESTLYALGEFTTHTANPGSVADERADVSALIGDWKKDRNALLARFDLDQDGTISMQEWELARMQAIREVRKQHLERMGNQSEGVHLLRKPRDRRLFLLANEMPDTLGRRYLWWSVAHLVAFLGLGIWGLILIGIK